MYLIKIINGSTESAAVNYFGINVFIAHVMSNLV